MELAKIRVHGVHAVPVCLKDIPMGITGATVRFEYVDSIWDGLTKTVVFRGCVTKDVLNAGEVVTIPAEVVGRAGLHLYASVYGVDADNNVIIPTIWADLGKIRAAADPSGDESTDPQLPVWAQLEAQIEELKEQGVSEEKIRELVDAYLQANPPQVEETDPTVPDWAKQPQKPSYTASEVGAMPAGTAIPAKISDLTNDSGFITKAAQDLEHYYRKSETYTQEEVKALVSAIPKFAISVVSALPTEDISTTTVYLLPGGEGSDLYTEYLYVDGAWEILGAQRVDLSGYATEAFVTATLAGYQPKGDYPLRSEFPAKLPNPKTLTFTGAVEATYDGSEAVTVEIPAAVTDEHINELINEALAAIPDASEVAY